MAPWRASMRRERRVDRRCVGDVEHARPRPSRRPPPRYAPIAAAPSVGRRGADHRRAIARQRHGDRAADAAGRAGDERDVLVRSPAAMSASLSAASASSSSGRSPSEYATSVSSMRRTRPASTLPGPHSTMCVDALRARTRGSCRPSAPGGRLPRSAARIASGVGCGATSTLCMHRNRGRARPAPARAARRSRSAAGFSSEQWNGADTGSSSPRLAPRALRGRDRALDRGLVAGDHDLPRRVEVGRLDDLALRAPRAHASRDRSVVGRP